MSKNTLSLKKTFRFEYELNIFCVFFFKYYFLNNYSLSFKILNSPNLNIRAPSKRK